MEFHNSRVKENPLASLYEESTSELFMETESRFSGTGRMRTACSRRSSEELRNLKVHRSMGADEKHLHLLKEVVKHYPSYLRNHGSPIKFPLAGKRET